MMVDIDLDVSVFWKQNLSKISFRNVLPAGHFL